MRTKNGKSRKKDKNGEYIKKTTQNYYLIAIRNLLNYFADKDITAMPSEKIKLPPNSSLFLAIPKVIGFGSSHLDKYL